MDRNNPASRQPPGPPRGGPPGRHLPPPPGARRGPAKSRDELKEEEKKNAQDLATRTGVPLWGAYRIVRGETSLDQLLKSILRREKFKKLQTKDGLDPDLAGHVSSGTLPLWRAHALQEMRKVGRAKFTRDRLETSLRNGTPLALWRFGQDDWEVGRIIKARTYDVLFHVEGREPDLVFKHDLKMVCAPEDLEAARKACTKDDKVAGEGLGASRDRKERFRPTDEQLLEARQKGRALKWYFRDGTMVAGKIFAFGRWDLDLAIGTGGATLFFHALHPGTAKAF